jgi:nitroreductase
MEFYEAVMTRRSVRSYKPDLVPEDALNRILEAVRMAPSGSNRQPWKFIVVTDSEKRRRLMEICGKQRFVGEAPVAIVGCGKDVKYNRGGYMRDKAFLVDVSIAFTHLLLAARAEGLGTCWIGDFENRKVKELFDVPDDFDVVAVTPLGYPDGDAFKETDMRKPFEDVVSKDKF